MREFFGTTALIAGLFLTGTPVQASDFPCQGVEDAYECQVNYMEQEWLRLDPQTRSQAWCDPPARVDKTELLARMSPRDRQLYLYYKKNSSDACHQSTVLQSNREWLANFRRRYSSNSVAMAREYLAGGSVRTNFGRVLTTLGVSESMSLQGCRPRPEHIKKLYTEEENQEYAMECSRKSREQWQEYVEQEKKDAEAMRFILEEALRSGR